jgi:DNA repair protein RadC
MKKMYQPKNTEVNLFSEMIIDYRYKENAPKVVLKQSIETYSYLKSIWDDGSIEFKEEFKAVYMNRNNRVIGWVTIGVGGIAGVVADPKVIFANAITAGASGIIISHNHPSGNLEPSGSDLEITRKIVNGAKLLDMTVLDHMILSKYGYFSFCDEGQLN